jgi:hypothetical protein
MGNSGEGSGECAVYPEMMESGGHVESESRCLPSEASHPTLPCSTTVTADSVHIPFPEYSRCTVS